MDDKYFTLQPASWGNSTNQLTANYQIAGSPPPPPAADRAAIFNKANFNRPPFLLFSAPQNRLTQV
jgi:hypothetical protein